MHTINSNVYRLRVLNSNHYCISKCIPTTSAFAPTNIALAHTTRIASYSLIPVFARVGTQADTWREEREDKNGGRGGSTAPVKNSLNPLGPLLLLLPLRLMLLLQLCW
jgi:hypothetical protein